ncbi:hypothetical protein [Polaribacter sp. ALD11]|uniref:hypothetical protein n=1 Tax=Polaribacter sp. ALD11 TaxID=2058137 RepID=UPI0012FD04A9|nr:hypothetical protein [Polaribacter sp. ALD11]
MNNDGFLDIFGVGNVYDAEIETIKYDASKSFILLSNSVREFQSTTDKSFYKKSKSS